MIVHTYTTSPLPFSHLLSPPIFSCLPSSPASHFLPTPYTPPAPSGPPQNLTGEFINSTSLRITWDPPLPNDQNGVIRGYNVSYNVSADESIFVRGTTVELGGLQKFTFYNVSVQAFTVGSGPIDSTVVQTDSDGEFTNERHIIGRIKGRMREMCEGRRRRV